MHVCLQVQNSSQSPTEGHFQNVKVFSPFPTTQSLMHKLYKLAIKLQPLDQWPKN